MADDNMSASTVIDTSADVIFGVLADPTMHAAMDGTGRVCEALDGEPLPAAGQVFRVAMYHENHPDGGYQMTNRVQAFDPPRVIAWEPGHRTSDGSIGFGGWFWRYDLTPAGAFMTSVILTYDWSAVPHSLREHIGFPPFPPNHLGDSLGHLAELATREG